MGEYIQLSSEQYPRKIGTCENLYYVRHAQLKAWVEGGVAVRQPGNLEPAAYLDPANGFRFRFPFPDEDDTHLSVADDRFDFNRGYGVANAPYFLLNGTEHGNAHAQIECPPGMWPKKRLRLPCPAGSAIPTPPRSSSRLCSRSRWAMRSGWSSAAPTAARSGASTPNPVWPWPTG